MVEPIKPIEGMLKDGEGQASIMADVMRKSYWKQKAQETPKVEAGDASAKAKEKKQNDVADKNQAKIKSSRTYAEFEINKETREVLVRIFDADSGELVRSIPPDELAKELVRGNLMPNQLRRRAILV